MRDKFKSLEVNKKLDKLWGVHRKLALICAGANYFFLRKNKDLVLICFIDNKGVSTWNRLHKLDVIQLRWILRKPNEKTKIENRKIIKTAKKKENKNWF